MLRSEVKAANLERFAVKAGFENTRNGLKEWLQRETTSSTPRRSSTPLQGIDFSGMDINKANAHDLYEIMRIYMKEREIRLKGIPMDPENEVPIGKIIQSKYSEHKSAPKERLVTDFDIANTEATIKELKTEFHYLEREHILNQPIVEESKVVEKRRRPISQLVQELHNPPPLHLSTHEQFCDSKRRGVNMDKSGVNMMFTDPSYEERSPNGKHFARLHNELTGYGIFRKATVKFINREKDELHGSFDSSYILLYFIVILR